MGEEHLFGVASVEIRSCLFEIEMRHLADKGVKLLFDRVGNVGTLEIG